MCFHGGDSSSKASSPAPAVVKSEPVQSNPDGTESRTNRLAAAEQDTGFRLAAVVVETDGDGTRIGRVVGFARVSTIDLGSGKNYDGSEGADRMIVADFGSGLEVVKPSDLENVTA